MHQHAEGILDDADNFSNTNSPDPLRSESLCETVPKLFPEAPLFIEACCGCGLLSSCMAKAGFETFSVDFEGNKHKPYIHVVQMDLRKGSSWEFFHHLAVTKRPFHFHGAPPCGTASRARDYAMDDTGWGPPPLRSESFPLGFPYLNGHWKAKVLSANAIYVGMAAFCFFLTSLGITWSIENPATSYMWYIEDYKHLAAIAFWVCFHSCMHGGKRKKLTGLLTTLKTLEGLESMCDGSHQHEEWGHEYTEDGVKFDTSKEAAYPKLLCERFSTMVALAANSLEITLNPQVNSDNVPLDARVATGKQPRGRRIPPIVAEFQETKTIRSTVNDEPVLDDKHCLVKSFHSIPVGSKLLRTAQVKGGETTRDNNKFLTLRVFGIYRSAFDFLEVAKCVMHPFDSFRALPDSMLKVISFILMSSPLQVMKKRLQVIQQWKVWAKELEAANHKLFAEMDAGCAKVLKGKHLVLLEKLATEIGWPDAELFADIANGFRLVGLQKPTGVFQPDVKPRTMSESELTAKSKYMKTMLWKKIATCPMAEFEKDLWDLTLEEVHDKHWLQGPYSFNELETIFEGNWNPARRFAVWQRNKWRPIDDFSESGVNACFSYLEKVDLKAFDEVIWTASCFVKFCIVEKRLDFSLSDGTRLCGETDKAWSCLDLSKPILMTKTVDLKSAYKQFAICPEDRRLSVLALKKPGTSEVKGFISHTLPFGSTAAVLHFNRASRLLHRLGHELMIPWANYYDDFPVVDFTILSDSSANTIRALMKILGFACSIDKELPFAPSAEMLGVVLDLGSASFGKVVIRNKEHRLEELANTVREILQLQTVEPAKLPALFGRALYAESQLMGRTGRLAMSELRILEQSRKKVVSLTEVQLEAFEILLGRYVNAIPRTLEIKMSSKPFLVFTDGACEHVGGKLVATVGGILFHPDSSKKPIAFGCVVGDKVVDKWAASGVVHPVALTELYAVCLARHVWCKYIDNSKCVFFIDNQGVLDACIKGYSPVAEMKRLLLSFETLDKCAPTLAWFARVPSLSNISDLPSRGKWEELASLIDFEIVEPECFLTGDVLQKFVA